MTKDEIKKALECCAHSIPLSTDCPYKGVDYCGSILKKDALDLITEQENEIDLLQMQMKDVANHADTFLAEANKFEAENKKLKAENKMRLINLNTALDDIKQAKIDVLNELKKRSYRDSVYFPEIKYQHKYVHMDDIDEMIEELKK